MRSRIKATAVFCQPFELKHLNEVLPAGEYQIEAEVFDPVDCLEPSVLVHLHVRPSHPGLSRTLTIPLVDLDYAVAKDKLTGKALTDHFLEEMLSDPMICLVMQADGISEAELRRYHYRPFSRTYVEQGVTTGSSLEALANVRLNVLPFPKAR